MTWRGPSQSFWYAASPPVSTEQKTTSTATVIDDLKRDSKYTLSYTLNKALANQVKLILHCKRSVDLILSNLQAVLIKTCITTFDSLHSYIQFKKNFNAVQVISVLVSVINESNLILHCSTTVGRDKPT